MTDTFLLSLPKPPSPRRGRTKEGVPDISNSCAAPLSYPFPIVTLLLLAFLYSSAVAATKVSFPYTPISAASLPWWIAKEGRYFEKHGLDVDMVYVGASPVIIQAMLGGQAGVGAGGGPPLVTNVLQGGDVVEVATTVPYAIQSLIVKSDIKTTGDLVGKKSGLAGWVRFHTTRCKRSSSSTMFRASTSSRPARRRKPLRAFRRASSMESSRPLRSHSD
jgi:hypothetical protein